MASGWKCSSGAAGRIEELVVLAAIVSEEVVHQRRDIFLALAQRRQRDVDHVQPVVEILAEVAFLDQLQQVGIGGGQDAHIHLDRIGGRRAA